MWYNMIANIRAMKTPNAINISVLKSFYLSTYYYASISSLESAVAYLATEITSKSSIGLVVKGIATKSTSKAKEGSSA